MGGAFSGKPLSEQEQGMRMYERGFKCLGKTGGDIKKLKRRDLVLAERYFRQACMLQEKALGGVNTLEMSNTLSALATTILIYEKLYKAGGITDESDGLKLIGEVDKIESRIFSPDHPRFVNKAVERGLLLHKLESYSYARPFLEKALDIYSKDERYELDSAPILAALAWTCFSLEEMTQARVYSEKAVAIFTKHNTGESNVADLRLLLFLVVPELEEEEETGNTDTAVACCGVSLRYMKEFIDKHDLSDGDFNNVCVKIKELSPEGSFADFLAGNADTERFVKPVADVFVSYAWKNQVGKVIQALTATLTDDDQDVFIWLDVLVVNQHVAALGNTTFPEWTNIFGGTLSKIGKAIVVMVPALKPISATRSWCVYEWYVLTSRSIPFTNVVDKHDQEEFIERCLQKRLTVYDFLDVFSGINISNAQAFNKTDQDAISSLVAKIGPIKVNDVIMKALKDLMVSLLDSAIARASEASNHEQVANVMISKSEMFIALGEFDESLKVTSEARLYVREHSVSPGKMGLVLRNMAKLHIHTFDPLEEKAEQDRRTAEFQAKHGDKLKGLTGEALKEVLYPLLREHMEEVGREEAASVRKNEVLFDEAIASFGDDQTEVASTLYDKGTMIFHNYPDRGEEALVILKQAEEIQGKLDLADKDNLAALARTKFEIAMRTAIATQFSQDAFPMLEQVLKMQTEALGPDHAAVGSTLDSMGAHVLVRRDCPRAQTYFERALEIRKRNLGTGHPLSGNTLFNLAQALGMQSKLKEALACAEESLAIKMANNPNTPNSADIPRVQKLIMVLNIALVQAPPTLESLQMMILLS